MTIDKESPLYESMMQRERAMDNAHDAPKKTLLERADFVMSQIHSGSHAWVMAQAWRADYAAQQVPTAEVSPAPSQEDVGQGEVAGAAPPFANCSYKYCDLPGQCAREGECHHPFLVAAPTQKPADGAEPVAWMVHHDGEYDYFVYANRDEADDAASINNTTAIPLYAAPAAAAGKVLVPAEPTEAMLNAARDWSYAALGKPVGNDGAIGCI